MPAPMNPAPTADLPFVFEYRPLFADCYHAVVQGWWGSPLRALRSLAFSALPAAALVEGGYAPSLAAYPLPLSIGIGTLVWAVGFTLFVGAALAGYMLMMQRQAGDRQHFVVDATGVERLIGNARFACAWDDISRVVETRRTFVLLHGRRPVVGLEKSALAAGGRVDALRRILRARKPGRYRDDAG